MTENSAVPDAAPTAPTASAGRTKAAARSMAPLINMGAAWTARKVMMKGYESATGKPAPLIHSPRASLMSKMLWGAAIGAVIALAEGLVWRMVDED